MKKTSKALILVLCAVVLISVTVLGTMAYLTDNAKVENTFTVGKVAITMVESKVDKYGVKLTGADAGTTTANQYKLLPGKTYVKDPTITVASDSENCWLFVKIENGLGANGTINGLAVNGWTQITGTDYWKYKETVAANATVKVFDTFTFGNADPAEYENKNITITAYAIQAEGFASAELAWTALSGQLQLS